jgi:hypothetical protein
MTSGSALSRGIGLIVFGGFLGLLGLATWNSCASAPAVNGVAPDCSGEVLFAAIGFVILFVGILLIVVDVVRTPQQVYPSTDPAVPPPLIRPVVVQETIVQPTVEVRCRYCGSLNPVSATRCFSCGAAL